MCLPQRPEHGFPWGCALPVQCWEGSWGPLEEQSALLAAEHLAPDLFSHSAQERDSVTASLGRALKESDGRRTAVNMVVMSSGCGKGKFGAMVGFVLHPLID